MDIHGCDSSGDTAERRASKCSPRPSMSTQGSAASALLSAAREGIGPRPEKYGSGPLVYEGARKGGMVWHLEGAWGRAGQAFMQDRATRTLSGPTASHLPKVVLAQRAYFLTRGGENASEARERVCTPRKRTKAVHKSLLRTNPARVK